MASLGPNSAGTGVDDATIGTVAWANPGNITSLTTSSVFAGCSSAITHYIKGTNYSFAIPVGATINGIVVEVNRNQSGTACP